MVLDLQKLFNSGISLILDGILGEKSSQLKGVPLT